jgi:hypothetical protein
MSKKSSSQSTQASQTTTNTDNTIELSGSDSVAVGSGAALNTGLDVSGSGAQVTIESVDREIIGDSLGFGEKALEILAGFGTRSISSANDRADKAVSAVERLAAVPTERNASPDTKNMLLLAGGVVAVVVLAPPRLRGRFRRPATQPKA